MPSKKEKLQAFTRSFYYNNGVNLNFCSLDLCFTSRFF